MENQSNTTLFYNAVKENDIKKMKKIIESDKENKIDIINYDNGIALYMAAKNGNFDYVKYLVTNGADINLQDNRGHKTALETAILNGHEKIAKFLIEKGAIIDWVKNNNHPNNKRNIIRPIYNKDKKSVKQELIDTGWNENHISETNDGFKIASNSNRVGYTILMLAIQKGFVDIAKLLIEKGADLDEKSYFQYDNDAKKQKCEYFPEFLSKAIANTKTNPNNIQSPEISNYISKEDKSKKMKMTPREFIKYLSKNNLTKTFDELLKLECDQTNETDVLEFKANNQSKNSKIKYIPIVVATLLLASEMILFGLPFINSIKENNQFFQDIGNFNDIAKIAIIGVTLLCVIASAIFAFVEKPSEILCFNNHKKEKANEITN